MKRLFTSNNIFNELDFGFSKSKIIIYIIIGMHIRVWDFWNYINKTLS